MAKHLNLEEQEQLDQLKSFWGKNGNWITWLLIAVLGSFAAWNGWNYWQRTQSAQAAALFDEIDRAVIAKDLARTEQATGDMQSRFGRTTFAVQASLLAAKAHVEAGQADKARADLAWVIAKAKDDSHRAVARLRLAAVELEAGQADAALKALEGPVPPSFEALVADRRGDVLTSQGKAADARAAYEKAWSGLAADADYRRLVEIKLASLGVDKTAAPATEGTKP